MDLKNPRRIFYACLAAYFAGAGSDRVSEDVFLAHRQREPPFIETRSPGQRFTSPLLECDSRGSGEAPALRLPKREIQEIIARERALGHIRDAAVYFRDLNSGLPFGLNEEEKFSPASLLKVPILISYLKWAESEPGILRETLCYRQRTEQIQADFARGRQLQLGRCYTVSDLIERMITESDNEAKGLLLMNLGIKRYEAGYRDLGVEMPTSPSDTMTVKAYASFFRIIFNASYLSRDASEKALSLLSQVKFRTGLRTGVPENVAIAHKFGERTVGEARQLHDCGIIYYPRHPYLLCVMSRGADFGRMDEAIEQVSRRVYEQVAKQFPER